MMLNSQGGASVLASLFLRMITTARGDARPTKFSSLFLVALILFFHVDAMAETTNKLSDAEIQGRQLVQQLLEQRPAENFTNTGVLHIRNGAGIHTDLPFRGEVFVKPGPFPAGYFETNWFLWYEAKLTNNLCENLRISRSFNYSNQYWHELGNGIDALVQDAHVALSTDPATPFAKSDFWLCDLGLEFFHWPAQKILPKTTNLKRGRAYTLLESTNPNPTTNGYLRVLSWIDKETGGILAAEAYDVNGKLLKEFAPKSFKKVDGQWQLQEMEIRNVQTGSRTRLEFDLDKEQ